MYRRVNADGEEGYRLICGTNQGILAEVDPHPNALAATSTTHAEVVIGPQKTRFEPNALLEEAQRGTLVHGRVGPRCSRGLVIRNTRTDLCIKEGALLFRRPH